MTYGENKTIRQLSTEFKINPETSVIDHQPFIQQIKEGLKKKSRIPP